MSNIVVDFVVACEKILLRKQVYLIDRVADA
jgi:hypothetical protein